MASSDNTTINTAISNFTIWSLFLVFLVLKLTGVINWSWWWVTAPLWGSFLLAVFVFTIVALVIAMWSK